MNAAQMVIVFKELQRLTFELERSVKVIHETNEAAIVGVKQQLTEMRELLREALPL